jgi:hypothetical protein
MKRAFVATALVLLVVVIHLSPAPVSCREYAVMLSRNINIRTGPGTDRVVVGRAWKGDIFDVVGETGNWYKIYLFSGESRYVSKSWAAKLTEDDLVPGHCMNLPADAETRRALHRDVLSAQARARGEAGELISASIDAERNGNLEKVFVDRFLLEVFDIYSVQPALYERLMDVAHEGSW